MIAKKYVPPTKEEYAAQCAILKDEVTRITDDFLLKNSGKFFTAEDVKSAEAENKRLREELVNSGVQLYNVPMFNYKLYRAALCVFKYRDNGKAPEVAVIENQSDELRLLLKIRNNRDYYRVFTSK